MTGNEELRSHKRIAYPFKVMIDKSLPVKGIDISEGGMYVYLDRLVEHNSIVDVTLPLADEELTVSAKVRHSQAGLGMGLMFVDLSIEAREKINQYIRLSEEKSHFNELNQQKVLLIDDNEISREKNKKDLLKEGMEVIDVNDGLEAIKYLNDETPDIIILDLFMQKFDSIKILSIIRGNTKWKHIPVLVYSSKGTKDTMEKISRAGANEFFLKIVEPTGNSEKLFDKGGEGSEILKHMTGSVDEK